MIRRLAAFAVAITLMNGGLASAWEPVEQEPEPFPPPDAQTPDPDAFIVPAGLYYVTDTYVADVTTSYGATTTYSTTTVHESTGTYARVLGNVDTGASSAFDGMAFNGRGALTDGRALAGTYYENFVLTASGYVPVSIVFFQDDSETRRSASVPSPSPGATAATTISAPGTTAPPLLALTTPAPSVAPQFPTMPPTPIVPGIPIAPVDPVLRAGVALAPDGPTLPSAEVLRGRSIQFWPRAFANDVAVPIRSWRLVSAWPDQISASSGSLEPLTAQWLRMPEPDVRWSLRFEITSEAAPRALLEAQITVTVRSPALID